MLPERLRPHGRLWLIALAASVVGILGTAGFIVGRWAASNSASADPLVPADQGGSLNQAPPGPNETPIPGSTPDRTRPYWYVPYENQDRLAPKFHGTINGIEVGRASGVMSRQVV